MSVDDGLQERNPRPSTWPLSYHGASLGLVGTDTTGRDGAGVELERLPEPCVAPGQCIREVGEHR